MRRFSAVASSLFTCLAACGGDDGVNHLGDAPQSDGRPIDAPPPPSMVNVTTLARSYETVPARTPDSGTLIFAVGPTGALVDTATTGADGKASVTLPEGGSVSAVYVTTDGKGGPSYTVVTYVGAKAGDSLTFGDATTSYTATGLTGAMTITWAAVANATRYRIYSPCYRSYSMSETTAAVALDPTCQAATVPVGVVAYDLNDNAIASVYLPAAPYTPDSTLTIAAGQWTAQAAAPNYTVALTNVDIGSNGANIAGYDEFAFGEFGQFWFSYPPPVYSVTPDTGTASQTLSLAATAPRHSAAAKLYHGTYVGRLWFFQAGASPISIDTGTIPWVETLTTDSAARTLAWTQSAGAYDAAALRFYWNSSSWTAILPPGVTALDASTAPAELAQYLPTAADGLNLYGCELVDLSSAASYDALRALPEWRTTSTETAVRVGDEPGVATADCGEGYHF